jgi:phosphoglycerate kinase
MGTSLVEQSSLDVARQLLDVRHKNRLVMPVDFVVATSPDAANSARTVRDVAAGEAVFDIGPETVTTFQSHIAGAETIIWNGPMGLFEVTPFDQGTRSVAEAVANSGAFSVVGGGDSVAALQQMNLADRISHISTGGGASLEFLEGKSLPGVAALEEMSS